MEKLKLGAQLYTVRDYTKTEDDFARTMEKIASIGYRYVQVSGTGPLRPEFIAQTANNTGIHVVLTHTPLDRILNDTDRVIEEHTAFGCDAIGVGGMSGYSHNAEGYQKFCADIEKAAEKIKQAGKVFLYHNHRVEFEKYNGKYGLELIMEQTDPSAVKLTFDCYWAMAGGVDPAAFITKYGDRIFTTHVKDMTVKSDKVIMTEMLDGNINYDSVIAACVKKNILWHMVEQDDVYMDAFESMKISFDNVMRAYSEYFE